MANVLQPVWKQELLTGVTAARLSGNPVKIALVHSSAAAYSSAHDQYADISAAVVHVTPALSAMTFASAVFDAGDTVATAVAGNTVDAYWIFVSGAASGSTSDRPLVAHVDTSVAIFPYTPNGANVNITFDASGIFRL